jgi:RecB family exonuclease
MTDLPIKQLSNSAIKCYLNCPFAFKAKYILKMKMPSNEHFALGNAIHSAAEFQIRFNLKHNKNLPLGVVLETYQRVAQEQAFKLNKYAINEFRRMYSDGHDLVEQFYFYLCKRKPLETEKRFSVDMGYGIKMAGIIDLIFENHALRDTKTTSKPWTASKLKNEMQFTIYYEAYKILYGVYPKTLGTIELDKNIIKTDKSPNAIREQLTFRSSSDREKLDITVEKVLRGITDKKYPKCLKRSCWGCSTLG